MRVGLRWVCSGVEVVGGGCSGFRVGLGWVWGWFGVGLGCAWFCGGGSFRREGCGGFAVRVFAVYVDAWFQLDLGQVLLGVGFGQVSSGSRIRPLGWLGAYSLISGSRSGLL